VALDTQVISPISPIGIAFSALTLVMGVIVVIAGSRVAPVLYTAVLCGVILASALDVVWWTLALVGMSLASISPLVGRVLFRTSALVGLWTLVLLLLTWLEAVASVFSKQSSKKAMKPLAGAIVVSAVLVSLFSIGSVSDNKKKGGTKISSFCFFFKKKREFRSN
jgi:predicted membrane channel-forming protein YqfA (hemolysin III family)